MDEDTTTSNTQPDTNQNQSEINGGEPLLVEQPSQLSSLSRQHTRNESGQSSQIRSQDSLNGVEGSLTQLAPAVELETGDSFLDDLNEFSGVADELVSHTGETIPEPVIPENIVERQQSASSSNYVFTQSQAELLLAGEEAPVEEVEETRLVTSQNVEDKSGSARKTSQESVRLSPKISRAASKSKSMLSLSPSKSSLRYIALPDNHDENIVSPPEEPATLVLDKGISEQTVHPETTSLSRSASFVEPENSIQQQQQMPSKVSISQSQVGLRSASGLQQQQQQQINETRESSQSSTSFVRNKSVADVKQPSDAMHMQQNAETAEDVQTERQIKSGSSVSRKASSVDERKTSQSEANIAEMNTDEQNSTFSGSGSKPKSRRPSNASPLLVRPSQRTVLPALSENTVRSDAVLNNDAPENTENKMPQNEVNTSTIVEGQPIQTVRKRMKNAETQTTVDVNSSAFELPSQRKNRMSMLASHPPSFELPSQKIAREERERILGNLKTGKPASHSSLNNILLISGKELPSARQSTLSSTVVAAANTLANEAVNVQKSKAVTPINVTQVSGQGVLKTAPVSPSPTEKASMAVIEAVKLASNEKLDRSAELHKQIKSKKQGRLAAFLKNKTKRTAFQQFVRDWSRWLSKEGRAASKQSGLWASQIRFVESRFGAGIVSYFVLLRWVFVLNLFLGLVWFVLVILLGAIDYFKHFDERVQVAKANNGTSSMSATDFFGGKGFYSTTFMFYGGYKAKILDNYRMDFAYLAVIFVFFIISFLAIIARMRNIFVRRETIKSSIDVDEAAPFATAALTSWDFSLSHVQTEVNHRYAIATTFKTLLSKLEVRERVAASARNIVKNTLKRILANVIMLCLLAFAGVALWNTLTGGSDSVMNSAVVYIFGNKENLFQEASTQASLLLSILNIVLPQIFNSLAGLQNFGNPEWQMNWMLASSFTLKISSIYVLLISFYINKKNNQLREGWETSVGSQFYALVWTNTAVTIVTTVLYGIFARFFLGRSKYDFDLANNILDIIYRQAIVWVGTIYSPVLIILSLIMDAIIFFVKRVTLTVCGLPPRRIYNSHTQNIYFLFFLLLALGLMVAPVYYGLTNMSPTCGPHGPESQGEQLVSAWDIVPTAIESINLPFFREILSFIGTVGFIVPVFLLLGLVIFYLQAVGKKRQEKMKELEEELKAERVDKRFLLRYYNVKT